MMIDIKLRSSHNWLTLLFYLSCMSFPVNIAHMWCLLWILPMTGWFDIRWKHTFMTDASFKMITEILIIKIYKLFLFRCKFVYIIQLCYYVQFYDRLCIANIRYSSHACISQESWKSIFNFPASAQHILPHVSSFHSDIFWNQYKCY